MKFRHVILFYYFISGLSSLFGDQNEKCQHDAKTFRCVQYIRNYDGDTITFSIPGIHPLLGDHIAIRIKGLDTPERKTTDPCEQDLAIIAQKLVESVLKAAKKIHLTEISRGKYFRIVANVIADGKSIKDILLQKKLAYPYTGKTKKRIDWCTIKKQFFSQTKTN